MNREQLDPIARLLIDSYLATHEWSREHTDRWEFAPTTMNKAHTMRSIVQAKVIKHDSLDLGTLWADFGRVEITHRDTGAVLVLRSESARAAERRVVTPRLIELPPRPLRPESLLVYAFRRSGLALSLAAATSKPKSAHLEMVGAPELVSTWAWDYSIGDADAAAFHQGVLDAFDDLDDLDIDLEDGQAE